MTHRRHLAALAALLLGALAAPLGAPLAQDAPEGAPSQETAPEAQARPEALTRLEEAVERALADPKLDGARVGVHVVDLDTGQQLFARNADDRFNPASNIKLLTSAAALETFGPHHTFTTRINAIDLDGDRVGGGLVVTGDGAGFILYEDVLDWAATIKARGVKKIEGGVTVEDGPFEGGQFLPPGYEQKSEDASYRAPVGAVSVNFNAVTVHVRPGEPGQPAKVSLDPPNDHVEVANETKTVGGSGRRLGASSITLEEGQGTRIVVRGRIGQSAQRWSIRKRIDNPPAFAGSILAGALRDLGVEVDGPVRRGEVEAEGTELVRHQSQPMVYLLMAMNKWSNNFMAEQLLRDLGTVEAAGSARGTWEGGRRVVRAFLERIDIEPGSFKLLNGSGLYDGNLVSPRAITKLLTHMHRHRWAPEYKASLAIAGVDGTLRGRLDGDSTRGRIRAKTGTLNEVTALSGYMESASGRPLAFSILFNPTPVRAWRLRAQQDAVARAIAEWEG